MLPFLIFLVTFCNVQPITFAYCRGVMSFVAMPANIIYFKTTKQIKNNFGTLKQLIYFWYLLTIKDKRVTNQLSNKTLASLKLVKKWAKGIWLAFKGKQIMPTDADYKELCRIKKESFF